LTFKYVCIGPANIICERTTFKNWLISTP
jgi:hypothetical protein